MNRREFVKFFGKCSFSFMLTPFDCKCPTEIEEPEEPVIINKAPTTNDIETTFQEIGGVKYYFSGSDSDGSVDYISVSVNNGSSENLEEGYYTFPIIQGNNKVTARAYDNWGKAGDAVEYSFVSPTEIEAKAIIEQYLVGKKNEYKSLEKDVLVSVGEDESFYTDFWIVGGTGKDGYINYIGYNKNLEKELSNQNLLSNYYLSSLYVVRIPEDEIKRKIDTFLRGFSK